jgi:hypothetical protein
MRFIYHRENLRTCPTCLVGLLGAAALAALPIKAYAGEDGAGAMATPAVSDNISEAAPAAWERIDNNSAIDASDGPILELPQVAITTRSDIQARDNSANDASTEDASAQDGSADDDTNDAYNVQPQQQVGNADDYEDQETVVSAVPLWPAPAAVVTMPRVYLGANYRAMPRPSVIVVRPGGLGSIPATSPMLSAPFRAGSTLGGWWQRVR